MASLVVHAVVPLLFLLSIRGLDARRVWMLWPLTILYDFDYFFGIHRTGTNVFTLIPFVGVLAYALARRRLVLAQWMAIALVYLVSHLVMDTFTGGTVLFWPVSDHTFCYYVEILIVTATNTPYLDVGSCSHPGVPQVFEVYPWLSYQDAALLVFILPAGLAMGAWIGWRLWRERRAASTRVEP